MDDIRAGRGVGVIDPKGDLIRALLERIPDGAASRLVLIDPTYRDYPIGLNVLECPNPDARELVCDAIVTIFRKTYERFWGPRTDDILRAAIRTLLRKPGAYPNTLGQPEAWKETGGFAGTFSPNAAFVQTVKPLAAGTNHTVKLQWKTNKPASGASIFAGAGPIPAGSTTFSPTRLTALLIATQ